ncbi:hypothetical protein [Hymenobacter latericus]|uniref:hypothetical protein n=1 Tax=Hymenobacter sp. YIM 151858-1 TaxID=2987688 RepID=UPI0022278CFE|nr:hypothetical protein [Hymenobacter sp. YIM 151858-1]UYZ58150.1 hypothetical protein OIS50_13910 [Hymenobacter sp. YIM 151858-1]
MKPIPVAVFLGALALASCEKREGPTLVEGQVVDKYTGRGVPHARVQVLAQGGSGLAGGFVPLGDPHPADAQGRFRFRFEAEAHSAYKLAGYAPGRYQAHLQGAPALRRGGRNNGLRLPALPFAWVRVRLTNVPPRQPADIYVAPFMQDAQGSDAVHLSRQLRDTTVLRMFYGNFPHTLSWQIVVNGQGALHQRPITYPPLDTTDVEIQF